MLRSGHVHKEPWEDHESEYTKARGERIKPGNFGLVYRKLHIYPGGVQTLVVIKEVRHKAEYTQQEEHELECIRRLQDHRFRVMSSSC